jgi:hypothetical protein
MSTLARNAVDDARIEIARVRAEVEQLESDVATCRRHMAGLDRARDELESIIDTSLADPVKLKDLDAFAKGYAASQAPSRYQADPEPVCSLLIEHGYVKREVPFRLMLLPSVGGVPSRTDSSRWKCEISLMRETCIYESWRDLRIMVRITRTRIMARSTYHGANYAYTNYGAIYVYTSRNYVYTNHGANYAYMNYGTCDAPS